MPLTQGKNQNDYREDLMRFEKASDLERFLSELSPVGVARKISRLDADDKRHLFERLGPEKSADIITRIYGLGAKNILQQLPPEKVVSIIEKLHERRRFDILRHLRAIEAMRIFQEIHPRRAKELQALLSYPENSAGGLMIPEYLAYAEAISVQDVLDDMEKHGDTYSDYDIQYAYVVSEEGLLKGVLRLRDILLAPKNRPISEIMIKNPDRVSAKATLQEIRDFFMEKTYLGVPVVDEVGKLIGVVRSLSVRDAIAKRSNQIFLKFAGIMGGEELRTMGLFKRSSRRLSWLSINIVLNIVAASVIALYQDTLEKAIVLAVFLPIISDMSGCSGNQAVAVSIRELTLGLVRPRELMRVLTKEASIGLINGIALGLLLGGAAVLWKGNPYLGLVVGAALATNTLVAVSFGGLVPLILRWMRTDPALASGPLLTTVTDMCGFFFVLSFATWMLPRLGG